MEFNIKRFIHDFIKREITRLFRTFIQISEDLLINKKISQEEFQNLRKKILDNGNDCVRSISNELDNFDLIFKKKED